MPSVFSVPSSTPSPSLSGFNGSVPSVTSSSSKTPSLSLSQFVTVTTKDVVFVFPEASVTVIITVFSPYILQSNLETSKIIDTILQLSVLPALTSASVISMNGLLPISIVIS